jgi:AraC-like DNA-binding protein
MTIESVVQRIIFSYGVVFVNFAFAIICVRRKQSTHWISIAFFADFGLMCVFAGYCFFRPGAPAYANVVAYLSLLALVPTGVALACEWLSPRGLEPSLQRMTWIMMAPVAALGFFLVAFGFEWKDAFCLGYAWLFVNFLVLAVALGIALRPFRDVSRPLLLFYRIVCLNVLFVFGMTVSRFFDVMLALYLFWLVEIASILVISFLTIRSPETFRLIRAAARNIRYERSNLSREKVAASLARLEALMTEKKLYLNGELSLEDLARRVELSAHQLSEVINIYRGKNFAWYVNSFRILSAKETLEREPGLSVLDVAYASGFNSKSVFNAAFRAHAGMTPTEYRNRLARGAGPDA